jgi:DNA polymerase III alpha subunit
MFLNCHTWFSFKYGTMSPERLFEETKRFKINKIVLTEINNTASYIEMLRIIEERKEEHQLSIALGIEFREGSKFKFIAIAKDNEGFEIINRYRSNLNNQKEKVPARCPVLEHCYIVYQLGGIEPELLRHNEFIGIRASQLTKFMLNKDFVNYKNKFVILNPVTFADKQGFNVHRLSRCIDLNTLLSKLPPSEQAQEDETLGSEFDMETKFRHYPALIRNTRTIIDNCSIDLPLGTDKNKKSFSGTPEQDWDFLITKAWEGFQEKYDSSDPVMRERFERELTIIKQKDFCTIT